LTLSLLVGAGLLLRTLVAVYRADAIVDTSRLMLAWLSVSPETYATPDRRMALDDQVLEALRRVPGIDDATVASAKPFYTAPVRPLEIEGRVRPPGTAPDRVSYVLAGPHYFDTLG